ncbi:MAG: TatD family hydrolase [Clostridiales bacterium]|nr:TatD family hydrolase [Clostridiales bacterium]
MYFESHAHYDDRKFDNDRYELIKKIHEGGVSYIVNAASDIKSSLDGINLSREFSFFYAAVGVHPHEVENMSEEDIQILRNYSKNEKVVAIGEIGLDFYYDFSPRDLQRKWFIRQLELAKELDMPVIIHSREASAECFDIIKESGVKKGVIHSYSGSAQMALDYIKLGFYIGVGGIVTFKNAKKSVDTVSKIPLGKILIETDSPYLAPEPVRGGRNNSQNLKYICEKIAQIKQITPEEVACTTAENSKNLFFVK